MYKDCSESLVTSMICSNYTLSISFNSYTGKLSNQFYHKNKFSNQFWGKKTDYKINFATKTVFQIKFATKTKFTNQFCELIHV